MAQATRQLGFEYFGISDHSQSAVYANGLKVDAIRRQHEEINALNETLKPFHVFKGIEVDILDDGRLDYEDEVLALFDFIIVSVHSRFTMNEAEMTSRIIKALQNPFTTILAHPTGRLLLKRRPYAVNIDAVLEAASSLQVAVEINSNPRRLDLDWTHLAKAKSLGLQIPICPDAHSIENIGNISYGISMARKGGLQPTQVLNCKTKNELQQYFLNKKPH
jgi:DNA polymerase (family 10)